MCSSDLTDTQVDRHTDRQSHTHTYAHTHTHTNSVLLESILMNNTKINLYVFLFHLPKSLRI